jgi:hypothetical protein
MSDHIDEYEVPSRVDSLDALASEAQLDALEAGQLRANAPVAFAGVIDNNLNTTFVDPRGLITVMLRPGREYSQVIDTLLPGATNFKQVRRPNGTLAAHFLPGKQYRVSAQTFNDNQGVLCTPSEYAQIRRQQNSPDSRRVQNEILAMREHQSQVTRETLPPEKRDREAALRKQAADVATAYERQQAEMSMVAEQQKQAKAHAANEQRKAQLSEMTVEDFEAMLAAKRERLMAQAGELGSRGRQALIDGIEADEQEERERFQAAQTQKALVRDSALAAAAPLEVRAQRLKALHDSGVLSQDDYDRQLAKLIQE